MKTTNIKTILGGELKRLITLTEDEEKKKALTKKLKQYETDDISEAREQEGIISGSDEG